MEEETQKKDPFNVGVRHRKHQEDVLNMVGDLLIPVTEGFDHINLDMTFTYLGTLELIRVENLCTAINLCHIFELKQSEYLFRGELATLLNSRRSRDAKGMNLFTTITAKQEQVFRDETQVKKGFSFFNFGKKKEGSS